jgi:hypothetical protein
MSTPMLSGTKSDAYVARIKTGILRQRAQIPHWILKATAVIRNPLAATVTKSYPKS